MVQRGDILINAQEYLALVNKSSRFLDLQKYLHDRYQEHLDMYNPKQTR